MSRYLHLNIVRIGSLGLGKDSVGRSRQGLMKAAAPAQVKARLERLRHYRWSSYRAYVGLVRGVEWLTTRTILQRGRGRSWTERARSYREYVEEAVRGGLAESLWERLEGQLLLGEAAFVDKMKQLVSGNEREQPGLKSFRAPASIQKVIALLKRYHAN